MKNEKNFKIHFIGVGGISMSALAKYFHAKGVYVSGSDIATQSETIKKLKQIGIKIDNSLSIIESCDIVVYSSAISNKDVQLCYAKSLKKIIISRPQLLKQIAQNYKNFIGISGTHGKTTATCMLAHIFDCANKSFTAHMGGYDSKYGNMLINGNNYFISEICEYNKNISIFDCDIGVILNVDNDHLDSYGSMSQLTNEFYNFAKRSKFCVLNEDDRLLKHLDSNVKFSIINKKCDYYAKTKRDKNGNLKLKIYNNGRYLFKIKLKNTYLHNAYNVLACVSVSRSLGIENKYVVQGLLDFKGIERRFELITTINGCEVIADYCHHPSQIKNTILQNQQTTKGNLFVIFQPHTYSRTKLLFEQFISVLNNVDHLFIYKTYPAREQYDYDGSSLKLSQNLTNSKHFDNFDVMYQQVINEISKNDRLLILGAGDLYDLFKNKLA